MKLKSENKKKALNESVRVEKFSVTVPAPPSPLSSPSPPPPQQHQPHFYSKPQPQPPSASPSIPASLSSTLKSVSHTATSRMAADVQVAEMNHLKKQLDRFERENQVE